MSEVKDIKAYLEDKTVTIKPIDRGRIYMGVKNHDGSTIFTDAVMALTLPRDAKKNQLVAILTKEEQAAFEKELNRTPGELSLYNKDSNFWRKEMIVKLTKEGLKLDLSNPVDNLKYRVIRANKKVIAPSWSERFEDAAYKFAIEEEGVMIAEKIKKADKSKIAWKEYGKIEDTISKLKNVLRLAGKTGITEKSDINFLRAQVTELIESDIDTFLTIINDAKFEIKLFVQDALDAKAIEKDGRTAYKFKGAGERFADTLEDAIEFFEKSENSDLYTKVKAQINNKK
jgi:hypothetical protein